MKSKTITSQELAEKLYDKTGLRLVPEDGLLLTEVDRGPRVDHGGGEDGDDWLDDNQLEILESQYKEKHQSKINSLKMALADLKITGNVSFDYGEKGHCTIYVQWK